MRVADEFGIATAGRLKLAPRRVSLVNLIQIAAFLAALAFFALVLR